MKLTREHTPDGSCKYALIRLDKVRELAADQGIDNLHERAGKMQNIAVALDTLKDCGVLETADVKSQEEFFVLKLKDQHSRVALLAYAESVRLVDPEFSAAVGRMADRAGAHHAKSKEPDTFEITTVKPNQIAPAPTPEQPIMGIASPLASTYRQRYYFPPEVVKKYAQNEMNRLNVSILAESNVRYFLSAAQTDLEKKLDAIKLPVDVYVGDGVTLCADTSTVGELVRHCQKLAEEKAGKPLGFMLSRPDKLEGVAKELHSEYFRRRPQLTPTAWEAEEPDVKDMYRQKALKHYSSVERHVNGMALPANYLPDWVK